MRRIAALTTLLLLPRLAWALELEFKPNYLELKAEGLSQRVSPGEFVEVPLGESSALEIDLSPTPPRKIDITSRGESEFVIFGATARLADGGKMTATMDPQTKKLDISWTKGEMKSPPGSFDKPSVVSFFMEREEELLRPLEFSGVRPFGYTDELEGRTGRLGGRDMRLEDMPPLNLPPPDESSEFSASRQWVDYESDVSAPPPITLPPPLPPKKKSPPSQLLYLEPSEAKSTAESDKKSEGEKVSKNSPEKQKTSESDKKPSSSQELAKAPKTTDTVADSKVAESQISEGQTNTVSPLPEEQRRRPRPTLYEIVMNQEKKQVEVMKMIEDMSKQVEILKEKTPASQNESQKDPSPAPTLSIPGVDPAPSSAPAKSQVPPPSDSGHLEFEVEVIGDEAVALEEKPAT